MQYASLRRDELALAHSISRVHVPSDLCLTPSVLIAVLRRMAKQNLVAALRHVAKEEIEVVVDVLITELDNRSGDPDLEPETDEDTE